MSRYVEIVNPDLDDCCLYCGGNAGMDAHARSCPVVTDVWLVGPREIDEDMVCLGCKVPFELGDHYTGRELMCLGCAAREAAA